MPSQIAEAVVANHDPEHLRSLEQAVGAGLVFARGFLLTTSEPRYVPAGWARADDLAPETMLWHDPRVPSASGSHGKVRVVVVGEIYSVDSPLEHPHAIAGMLAELLDHASNRFLDAIDRLHGRYILVVVGEGASPSLYHDATGMRTVYYSTGGRLAASHPALVAANTGEEPRSLGVRGYGTPGLATPFPTVRLLPPNHALDVWAGTFSRYWPRTRVRARELDEAVEVSAAYLGATLRGVLSRHDKVLASLTAGTDSRVTLATALSEEVADRIEFFTYRWNNKKWIDVADQRIATALAQDFDLDHSMIDLDQETEPSGAILDVLELNAFRVHSRTLASAYHRVYGDRQIIHVRSNLSEIMRTFYLKKAPTPRPANGRDLAAIYRRSIRDADRPSDADWSRAIREFEAMYRETGFRRASRRIDARDLMYWEHRMGSWHGQVVLESDIAFDTVSLYNSRLLLTTMLGPRIDLRMDDRHMRGIIASAPGDLLKHPFNPGPKRVKSGRDGAQVLREEDSSRAWWTSFVRRP